MSSSFNSRMSLADRARKFSVTKTGLSIIEFAELPSGLNQKLLPAQKFLLKVFEKEDLDDTIAYIPVRDQFNEKTLYTLTEAGFYEFLRAEGRFSLKYAEYQQSDIVQINLCMGRRASKTTVITVWIAYKLYQLLNIYHPQDYFGIMKRDPMNITMTALGQDNAEKLFKRFVSLLQGSPFFRPFMLEAATTDQIKIWTQYDLDQLENITKPPLHSHSITITAAANSSGVRGENNMFVIADEFAHFNRSAKSTRDKPLDEAIYEALTPSTSGFTMPPEPGEERGKPWGKSLFLSSPNGPGGKFWQDCQDANEKGARSGTLFIQAATWEINPIVHSAFLRKEYNKNPASYEQEYGGKFITGGMNWLSDLPTFYTSFDNRLNPLQPTGRRDRVYFLGIDFALSNDGTACSICHFEPDYDEPVDSFIPEAFAYWQDPRLNDPEFLATLDPQLMERDAYDNEGDLIPYLQRVDKEVMKRFNEFADLKNPEYLATLKRPRGRFVVDYSEVRYAGKPPYAHRKTLLLDDVLDWVQDLYWRWPIKYGVFDQWSGEIISQMVEKRGLATRLEMIKFNEHSNDSMYKLFSSLLHQNDLKLPPDPTLIRELLALRVELRSHGMIKVEVPASAGHDDRFDSIIRAVYLAYAHQNKNLALAGHNLQNLFNARDPVSTTGDLRGVSDPKLHEKLKQTYHQTQYSIRSPNVRTNMLKIMPKGRGR